jgi:hypothetical protein
VERLGRDINVDYGMSATEALEYGVVDRIEVKSAPDVGLKQAAAGTDPACMTEIHDAAATPL